MLQQDISLDICWPEPDIYIGYLEKGNICVSLRNNLNKEILIESCSCYFQTDDGSSSAPYTSNHKIPIGAKQISDTIRINFKPDLSLRSQSNSYSLVVQYRHSGSPEILTWKHESQKHVVINPKPAEKLLFISHKVPQNTELAEDFTKYVRKIGYEGYLAEKQLRPGLDMWKEKIIPTIDRSAGIVVIWTSDCIGSEPIIKEIRYARRQNKRIMVLKQRGTSLPEVLDKDIDYFESVDERIANPDLIKMVELIYETNRNNVL